MGEKLTWLDATAEVAPYGLIAYQLRNKQAVIASSEAAGGLHRTPAESPVKNATTLNIDAKFSELGALDAKVDLTATGDDDWPMRGTLRQVSQANWPRVLEFLSRAWGLPGDVTDIHVDAIENTAKPLHLSYHLHKADYFKVPSSATNFQLLPPMSGGRVQAANKKHPGEPLDVGPAEVRTYHVRAELPANFTLHVPADVSVTRDYGEYSSSYKLLKNTLEAERRLVLKVNELPASKRADFSSFHNVTTSAVEETPWCSIAKPSASALASASELKGTSTELREAGQAALKRQDFATAATLLQRAADQDPATKEGWDDLGQAYARLNQHQKATQAFEKQIDADPDHAHAHAELGAELQQLGRFDDAIAAYKKQIEVAPSEKASHKQLGLLFSQLKRDQEARTELEAAALLPPDDPDVQMALAQVYSRLGESKKADVIMVSLTGTTSLTGGTDFFAGALSEDADPVQSAHDAEKNLSDISDQFESGEYDRLDASAFSVMDLVALSWARMGWARFLQGDNLAASQFLDAAWQLSQSGTVANRLAKVYEKTGARDRARHMSALAVASGGGQAQSSRQQLLRLTGSAANAEKEESQAAAELEKMRNFHLAKIGSQPAAARFALLFDNSSAPDRAQFLDGDASLREAGEKLQKLEFPVRFPDVSSIKVVRLGTLSCGASECLFSLLPLQSAQPANLPLQAGGQTGFVSKASESASPTSSTADYNDIPQVGPGMTPPRAILAPDPDYPDAARRAKKQGTVVLRCIVGADGLVHDAQIKTSLRGDLDASAIQAVRGWKFEPATKEGKPVTVQVNVEVTFHLYKDPAAN